MADCKPTYKGVRYNDLSEIIEVIKSENFGNPFDSDNVEVSKRNSAQYQKAQNLEGGYDDVVSPFEKMTKEEQVSFEKTIRDLSARIADRIGLPYKVINNKSQKWKGRIVNNRAEINLAYATLDTPIHEILGHPIIRAIKKGNNQSFEEWVFTSNLEFAEKYPFIGAERIVNEKLSKQQKDALLKQFNKETTGNIQLYQNLLKELEYGKGKEVLDRVKRNYIYKSDKIVEQNKKHLNNWKADLEKNPDDKIAQQWVENLEKRIKEQEYTLEEQQEEAIVELLGLYTAGKLDKVKDGKLISLLKRLLKEMKAFMRSLFNQKEVEIDKLPDNMTLGDIADLLAYSNSKLILPGNEVVYTTPDNQTFKTYQEASNHISELSKLGEVDLNNVDLDTRIDKNNLPSDFKNYYVSSRAEIAFMEDSKYNDKYNNELQRLRDKYANKFVVVEKTDFGVYPNTSEDQNFYNTKEEADNAALDKSIERYKKEKTINRFIERNKQYEQSKEIIEEWKKVNDIKYDPKEVYSRGQGFYSSIGAYSDFDVDLMMQNLLQHLEDNKKAGGEFTVSAFTKPVDKRLKHIEGSSGKIRFKIFPKSEDIKWAANTDVYSGSVWDASDKVSKDSKSEIVGVSYTKAPSLENINSIQPNLASIIDNLDHHHNELGIELTGENFRIEYDEDIPYSTKKILDNINNILNQKYGKLVESEISKKDFQKITKEEYEEAKRKGKVTKPSRVAEGYGESETVVYNGVEYSKIDVIIDPIYYIKNEAIQPTQTKENLKESVESVKNKIDSSRGDFWDILTTEEVVGFENKNGYLVVDYSGDLPTKKVFTTEQEAKDWIDSNLPKQKEYTSQAEINTKVAALKKGMRKFPRSLIRGEVRDIGNANFGFNSTELPFQRVNSDMPLSPRGQVPKIPKYELFPGVYANIEQKEAIDGLIDFLQNDEEAISLVGRGGTGKTTIIKKVMDKSKSSSMFIAPTHKAKTILSQSVGKKSFTLASALAIKLNEATGEFKPDLYLRQDPDRLPIKKANYIVIDEGSMVNDELFDEVMSLKNSSAKVIFMGDNVQLPPVGQETDSKMFNLKQFKLTERMRQGEESPIVPITDKVAENVESEKPVSRIIEDRQSKFNPDKNEGVLFLKDQELAIENFIKDFKEYPTSTKIITFNNERHKSPQSVGSLNRLIRSKINPNNLDTVVKGDQLMAYSSTLRNGVAMDEELDVQNSSDYTVVKVEEPKEHKRIIMARSRKLGNRTDTLEVEGQIASLRDNNSGIVLENILIPTQIGKEQVIAFKNKYAQKKDYQMLYKVDEKIPTFEFGYAITSHKSQGSTYRNTYIMEDNILAGSYRSNKSKNQSLYVGISRASHKAVILSDVNPSNDIKTGETSNKNLNVYWGGQNVNKPENSPERILSNLAPREFEYEGRLYGSVEHAYQTNKSGEFHKTTYHKYIKEGKYGKKIKGKPINKDFDNLELMRGLVVESFKQNSESEAAKVLLEYDNFTHNTNTEIDKAFLEGLKLAQQQLKKIKDNIIEDTSDLENTTPGKKYYDWLYGKLDSNNPIMKKRRNWIIDQVLNMDSELNKNLELGKPITGNGMHIEELKKFIMENSPLFTDNPKIQNPANTRRGVAQEDLDNLDIDC